METHCHDKKSPESDAPVTTILDVLNADCWRAVLDYLDIDDIVSSERVSRGWQQVVLGYLPGVKSYYYTPTKAGALLFRYRIKYYRRIKLKNVDEPNERRHILMLRKMLKKLSPYFVNLCLGSTDSWEFDNVKIVFEMNELEDLTLCQSMPRFLEKLDIENCKQLKRVTFESCSLIRDHHLEKLITNSTIEDVSVTDTYDISGEFLINLKSNIKYLSLNKCWNLDVDNLFNSLSLISTLTKLELNNTPLVKIDSVSMLVAKMPKVEVLSFNGFKTGMGVDVGTELALAIGQLIELKSFSMSYITTDAVLKSLASGCKKLRSLHIDFCPVSGAAVVSLCRDLPDLTELSVADCRHVTDEVLARCISSANITVLDARYCPVSGALVAAAAREVRRRPRRLLLRLSRTPRTRPGDLLLFQEEMGMGLKVSLR